jgi:hypothetical protein
MARTPGSGHAHLMNVDMGDLGIITGRQTDIRQGHHHAVEPKTVIEGINGPTIIEGRLLLRTMT